MTENEWTRRLSRRAWLRRRVRGTRLDSASQKLNGDEISVKAGDLSIIARDGTDVQGDLQ